MSEIDPKCLSCKFYMHAEAIQIWCDKLGVREAMPTKACEHYELKKKIVKDKVMKIQLTKQFPKKDGIYILRFEDEEYEENVEDEDYEDSLAQMVKVEKEGEEISITPIPCHNHNDCFMMDKKLSDESAWWYGPIEIIREKK